MDEFDWIQTYLAPLAGPEGLKLLDDAALYTPSDGQDLILTQDSLIEGIHFLQGEYGAGTASRLMAVNLSDLAAKGARPVGYLLSVAWPKHLSSSDLKRWMHAFSKGLKTEQDRFGFSLFGGDTVKTEGPMSISATFIGVVPRGKAVLRSGAQLGDDIWVTGTIGDAYLGLQLAQKTPETLKHGPSREDLWVWEEAFRHPTPRLLFRKTLRRYATACADISDGLLSEAGHIAKASQKSLSVKLADIPLSNASLKWCTAKAEEARRVELATNGDDYELLFTARPEDAGHILTGADKINLAVTRVGKVTEGESVHCQGLKGQQLPLQKLGYSHN
ncbi:thiamine-phosphate kinase [Litorimonas haliclonae]|uniref:thiamine-phosphate kinase n=1 Tax=Litorimonas haliclonae TaxID=2081977 RepID=UPI0039EF032D